MIRQIKRDNRIRKHYYGEIQPQPPKFYSGDDPAPFDGIIKNLSHKARLISSGNRAEITRVSHGSSDYEVTLTHIYSTNRDYVMVRALEGGYCFVFPAFYIPYITYSESKGDSAIEYDRPALRDVPDDIIQYWLAPLGAEGEYDFPEDTNPYPIGIWQPALAYGFFEGSYYGMNGSLGFMRESSVKASNVVSADDEGTILDLYQIWFGISNSFQKIAFAKYDHSGNLMYVVNNPFENTNNAHSVNGAWISFYDATKTKAVSIYQVLEMTKEVNIPPPEGQEGDGSWIAFHNYFQILKTYDIDEEYVHTERADASLQVENVNEWQNIIDAIAVADDCWYGHFTFYMLNYNEEDNHDGLSWVLGAHQVTIDVKPGYSLYHCLVKFDYDCNVLATSAILPIDYLPETGGLFYTQSRGRLLNLTLSDDYVFFSFYYDGHLSIWTRDLSVEIHFKMPYKYTEGKNFRGQGAFDDKFFALIQDVSSPIAVIGEFKIVLVDDVFVEPELISSYELTSGDPITIEWWGAALPKKP